MDAEYDVKESEQNGGTIPYYNPILLKVSQIDVVNAYEYGYE